MSETAIQGANPTVMDRVAALLTLAALVPILAALVYTPEFGEEASKWEDVRRAATSLPVAGFCLFAVLLVVLVSRSAPGPSGTAVFVLWMATATALVTVMSSAWTVWDYLTVDGEETFQRLGFASGQIGIGLLAALAVWSGQSTLRDVKSSFGSSEEVEMTNEQL